MGTKRGKNSPPPSGFNGAADAESIKNFIVALEKYFDLLSACATNNCVRFSKTLLQEKTIT